MRRIGCAHWVLGVGSLCLLAGGCLVESEENALGFGGPPPADGPEDPGGTGPGPGGGSSSSDDGGTGHGLDPVEPDGTGGAPDPGGGTTGPDPTGGTTGGVDPSGGTTGGVDPSGGGSTGGGTGGGEPAQPSSGMWAHCLSVNDCEAGYGCLTNDDATDGFCSTLCTPAGDPSGCGTPPGSSVATCTMAGGGESVCALGCAAGEPCPGGMTCSDTSICM